jgi:hypothetical protein
LVSGRSFASGPVESSAQAQLHPVEEDRRRQHELGPRLHEEHERAAEERLRTGAERAARAALQRREQREAHRRLTANRPPKSEEEILLRRARGRLRNEERRSAREP